MGTMKMVAIPVAAASEQALNDADAKGHASFNLACTDVQSGGTIVPDENKCYKLVFDQNSAQSLYTIDAKMLGLLLSFVNTFQQNSKRQTTT